MGLNAYLARIWQSRSGRQGHENVGSNIDTPGTKLRNHIFTSRVRKGLLEDTRDLIRSAILEHFILQTHSRRIHIHH